MVTVSIPTFHLWTLNKQEDVRLGNSGTIFTKGRIFVPLVGSALFEGLWTYCKADRYFRYLNLLFTKIGIFEVDLAFTNFCST